MRIMIINGPNINLLGTRETTIYGTKTYKDLVKLCRNTFKQNSIKGKIIQTNSESKIIELIQKAHHKYDAIIMDPPSYGRGPNNELFKFEDKINEIVELSVELLSDNPSFIIINTYTTGYSQTVIKNVLKMNLEKHGFKAEKIESDEIGIKVDKSETVLPCGHTCRWKYEGSL